MDIANGKVRSDSVLRGFNSLSAVCWYLLDVPDPKKIEIVLQAIVYVYEMKGEDMKVDKIEFKAPGAELPMSV